MFVIEELSALLVLLVDGYRTDFLDDPLNRIVRDLLAEESFNFSRCLLETIVHGQQTTRLGQTGAELFRTQPAGRIVRR